MMRQEDWPQTYIPSEKADIKFPTKIPVLLVANGFNWSSIYSSRAVLHDKSITSKYQHKSYIKLKNKLGHKDRHLKGDHLILEIIKEYAPDSRDFICMKDMT